ncbi:MAG: diguanylate cyclase [Halothiobacillaceae bacterium]
MKILDLLIVGAGPLGVEAAAYARRLGLDAVIVERGDRVGAGMRRCVHARMFSPWQYNHSPLGIDWLRQDGRYVSPEGIERWRDYLTNYLEPLAEVAGLEIRFGLTVRRIGRAGLARTDMIGSTRAQYPFKVLVRDAAGHEDYLYAWRVIDASGVMGQPLSIGEGRVPALGEQALADRIYYHPCNLAHCCGGPVGPTWLVIGNNYFTAGALLQIEKLMRADPATRLVFVDEQGRRPFIGYLKDDLFESRVAHVQRANALLESGNPGVHVYDRCQIRQVESMASGFRVTLDGPRGAESVLADQLVATAGYEGDVRLFEDLQVHLCYASGAPMNYAAEMLEDTVAHRHTPWVPGPDAVRNPEPNFYVLGAKSYGRNPGYSLHIGLGQITLAFRDMLGAEAPDLYAGIEDSPIPSTVCYVRPDQAQVEPMVEGRLSDSEQKYKTIADNLEEVIFQTDLKQKVTYLSPSWTKLTGHPVEPMIGRHWQDLLYTEDRDRGLAQCNAFMSCKTADYHEELRVECADGTLRWTEVNAHVLLDLNGVAYGTIGSMLDITERVRILEELKTKNQLLDRLAVTDGLTGLYNRRRFDEQLASELKRAQRERLPLTLAVCDIDHFKEYNDTYGHQPGDVALKLVAKAISKHCRRDTDFCARYGGEEFAILLPGCDRGASITVLEAIRQGVEELGIAHRTSSVAPQVTLSLGAISLEGESMINPISPEILLKRADDALYESKRSGRNRLTFSRYDELPG